MKIGRVSINAEAFKDKTKEEFFDIVKGSLDIDKELAWKKVCEFNGVTENASTDRPSKQNKKTFGK